MNPSMLTGSLYTRVVGSDTPRAMVLGSMRPVNPEIQSS